MKVGRGLAPAAVNFNAECKMQNADFFYPYRIVKLLMTRLFLCKARRQKRSIVNLCEHFGVRRTCAKRTRQNNFKAISIT